MLFSAVFALAVLSTGISADEGLVQFAARHLHPRQGSAFTPGTSPVVGTCASIGKVNCGSRLCIGVSQGEICCDPASNWGCPRNSFCLVNGKCCPTGLDPKTCASQLGVNLPSDFVTKAPVDVSKPTSAAPSSAAPSSAAPSPAAPSSSKAATSAKPSASASASASSAKPSSAAGSSAASSGGVPSKTAAPSSGASGIVQQPPGSGAERVAVGGVMAAVVAIAGFVAL